MFTSPKPLFTHLQLGFDADMLELLLRELDDVVDKFFIIESTRTHNKVRVPLDPHIARAHTYKLYSHSSISPSFALLHMILGNPEDSSVGLCQEPTKIRVCQGEGGTYDTR